ncbi:alpha/beta fold hydrolase [Microbacterium aureliae]
MPDIQIFEPEGRAIPFVDEGEGPIKLILIPEPGEGRDALGVVGHYLAEEAGFHVVRIGHRAGADATLEQRAEDVTAVMDHLGIDRSWIGGHGFGGTVARATVLAHADRANGLLLLGVEDADVALAPVVPVLIVQGADDEVTPAAAGASLQATAPDRASVKELEGAGHYFPLTHPIETAVIIEEYLDWD